MNTAKNKVYATIDEPINGTGDVFIDRYPTLEEAKRHAMLDWLHLTDREKAKRTISVAEGIPDDDGECDFGNRINTLSLESDKAISVVCDAVQEAEGIELVNTPYECLVSGVIGIRVTDEECRHRDENDVIRERLGNVSRNLVACGEIKNTDGIVSYILKH